MSSRLCLGTALCLLLLSSLATPARADLRAFSAGSLIIPMDACHQASVDQLTPSYCVNPKTPNDGVIKAYGLVFMLLKRGITVYLSTNPDKTSVAAIDFSLTRSGGGTPVGTYDRSTRTFNNFTAATQVDYRGAPFIIDVSEAQNVLNLLASDPVISTYTSIAIHIAYDNFIAPVAMRMNGLPPRVAVFVPASGEGGSNGTEGIPLMRAYLRRAGLDYAGAVGTPASHGEIYDTLTPTDVTGGALSTGGYQVVWLPHYTPSTASTAILTALRDFVDGGGMLFAECGSIQTLEGNSLTRFMTTAGIAQNRLPDCYPGNVPGFRRNGETSNIYTACYNPKPTIATWTGSSLQFPAPASPYVQMGDFLFYKLSGTTEDWVPASGSAWRTGVRSLLRAADTNTTYNGANIVQQTYKDNDTNKGQIIYFGGHLYGDSSAPMTAGIRVVLNTLMFAKPTLSTRYMTRSGPSILQVGSRTLLFQGSYLESNSAMATFNSAADTGWPFPQILGQFRAYDTQALTVGTQSLAADEGGVWNAGMLIPTASARRVLTSVGSGANPTITPLTQANLSSLGTNPFGLPAGYTSADETALLDKIRGAQLGGIDHSTPAVIGQQSVVPGGATRPTVAYVGALDGMLHAFMVEGSQATPGTELWAFLPGDQLATVRSNGAALDSSPTVSDTFDNIGGVRKWRTLLTLGQGRNGTLLYGVDVSDPINPAILWRRGTTATGLVLGLSQGASFTVCPTSTNPFQSHVIVASSKVGGGSGITVTALSGADGSQLWRWSTSYSRTLPGTSATVPNDMPAPVALGDTNTASACEDRVYVVDLEGRIWELNTLTGQNVNGTSPLADVGLTPGSRVQPIGAAPALYISKATNHHMLAVVTGGADWAYATDTYAFYAFDIESTARQADTGQGVAPRVYRTALNPGYRGYASPTVSGNDVYVLASNGTLSGAISSTVADGGQLSRINLGTGQVTHSANVTKGAGAFVSTADGTIYGTTARDVIRINTTGADRTGDPLRNKWKKPMRRRLHLEMP